MAKTANKPRMTCARQAKSDHKIGASKQHHQPLEEAATGLPPIENMEDYGTSSDGSESDHSTKVTPLGMSVSESEQEEYSTPEADKAVDMEAESEEDANITEDSGDAQKTYKPPNSNNSPQIKTDKRVRFAASKAPPQTTHKKHEDGLPGSAGPRAGNPEGIQPNDKTQVSREEIRRALERPLDYRKVAGAPAQSVPNLLEAGAGIESPLEKATRIYQCSPRVKDNPEAKVYKIAIRWHCDRREILVAEDPQAHAFKLGMPIKHGNRLELVHVRAVTGSNLDPSDTGPTGFPYTGTPQLKIVDLDEIVGEVLKYLRYLNSLLHDISNSPEAIVFELEHTHAWLNCAGRVRQINLAFQNRPLAAFVHFNTVFRLPMHVVPQAHQTCTREALVLPCVYVWSPWTPVEGPVADRSILVHGPQLIGQTIEDVSNILAVDIIHRQESRQELGQLVDRVRRGTVREAPEDATHREILLLEAEVSEAAAAREVAIADKKQVLLSSHRRYLVAAVVEHIVKLTQHTTTLRDTNEIFDLHVPSRQWAPSTPEDPASLLQWKRNGNGSINYYAIFTEEAYEALAKAGKQSVQVPAGVDNRGKHITVSVTLEVGRWSAKGAGTIERQAPRTHRGREREGARFNKIVDTVASKLIDEVKKVEDKANEILQQTTTSGKQSTPETKTLLKNINKQLARFNESKPVTVEELRELH
ncbi:hypothetical protein CYMTET_3416 [Cymbomonas tetramitiformis]|uniref:Uncharacterized protein n=1 Tax=Cymbomonas tetramitiformis TaxID=36881 RepID=A0AAE0LLE4_9CHLO|nr:hypothetical protein CYMTET_3416 [Cymbomonas tetramitiformis]